MRSRAPTPRRLPVAGLLVLAAVLLSAFPTAQQTGDGLSYALSARDGEGLFHPHHLLYSPAVRVVHRAVEVVRPESDPIAAGQLYGIAWALVGLASFSSLARRSTGSEGLALAASLLLLGTHGFWLYATTVEVYLPALGCLLLTAALVAAAADGSSPRRRRACLYTAAAFAWAAATFHHQTNALFALPLAVYLLVRHGRTGLRAFAFLAGLAGGVTLGGYLLAFYAGGAGWWGESFLDFALRYTRHPDPSWGSFANFGEAGVLNVLWSQTWCAVELPARWWRQASLAAGAFAIAVVLWHLGALAARRPAAAERAFALAWIGAYWVFFLWWLPSELEFFAATLAPWILLLALALRDLGGMLPARLAAAPVVFLAAGALAVGARNFEASILPRHREPSAARVAADDLGVLDAGGCTLAAPDFTVMQHLVYYHGRPPMFEDTTALLVFYRGLAHEPQWIPDDLEKAPCIVAPWWTVTPDRRVAGFSGQSHPEGWLAHLRWLLDIEPAGGDVRSRAFRVEERGGRVYLVLLAERRRWASEAVLLVALDDALAPHLAGTRPLAEWLAGPGRAVASTRDPS